MQSISELHADLRLSLHFWGLETLPTSEVLSWACGSKAWLPGHHALGESIEKESSVQKVAQASGASSHKCGGLASSCCWRCQAKSQHGLRSLLTPMTSPQKLCDEGATSRVAPSVPGELVLFPVLHLAQDTALLLPKEAAQDAPASPGGHMWQCRQSAPLRHPAGFQFQAQGRQLPQLLRAAGQVPTRACSEPQAVTMKATALAGQLHHWQLAGMSSCSAKTTNSAAPECTRLTRAVTCCCQSQQLS